MAEDPLNDIMVAVRARLQDELETQLRAVSERHQQSLAAARQQIEADATEQWAARLETAKSDLETVTSERDAQIRTAVDGVRAEMEQQRSEEAARLREEADRQLAAETARLRAEADQRTAEAAAHVRRQMEQALAAERQLAQARLDAERRTAAEQLEQAREAFDAERGQWSSGAAADAPGSGSLSQHADSLVRGLREIDAAESVSASLTAIARAAAAEAPRAALFVANGAQLDEWSVSGLPSLSGGPLNVNDPDSGIVVEALTRGHAVRHNGSACAVPLVLDGTAIGVLYGEADADTDADGGGASWTESLEAVARYGAARLGYLTALRTAQARQWLATVDAGPGAGADASDETVAAARRYARLVISEIKLYNEPGVHEGRGRRDLLQRLGPEIERARRLYEERVPASVAGRTEYFQRELVQTLAGGDPSLLG